MNKEEFYAAVAVALGVEDTYEVKLPYKRRWGQRNLGNGRYEGIGVVRWFGPNCIHVAFHGLTDQFDSSEAALAAIQNWAEAQMGDGVRRGGAL